MAAGNSSNAIYYGISNGKIVRQFANRTEKSVERVNKNGKTVHEEFYDYLDGVITEITTKDSDYGKFWIVWLLDEETKQNQILQFNYSSGYANGFLKALPNVDVNEKVKIIPSAKKEGDKTKATVFINQHGKAAKWAFTKDTPNGLPELRQVKIKGKMTYDDSEIMEFLENMVKEQIVPKLKKSATPVGGVTAPALDLAADEDLEPAPF